MSSMQGSLAFELFRPTLDRYAPLAGALLLVGAFWIWAMDGNDDALQTHDFAPSVVSPSPTLTTKAGELDVPLYYFPDAATGTDRYVGARDGDCGQTAGALPHDYPQDWLRP